MWFLVRMLGYCNLLVVPRLPAESLVDMVRMSCMATVAAVGCFGNSLRCLVANFALNIHWTLLCLIAEASKS